MYCSPWPRGCTWELAVLKDSEAKQSCYLLRSAPPGSFSPVLLPGPSPRPHDRPGGGPRPAAHAAAARAFLQPGPCGRPSRPGAFAKVLPLLGTFYHSGLSPSGTPDALHHPRCAESLPGPHRVCARSVRVAAANRASASIWGMREVLRLLPPPGVPRAQGFRGTSTVVASCRLEGSRDGAYLPRADAASPGRAWVARGRTHLSTSGSAMPRRNARRGMSPDSMAHPRTGAHTASATKPARRRRASQ